MEIQRFDTAVVFIDPQNDVLSEKGTSWAVVGASVTENGTVENMCVESHLREFLEQGFETAVVRDATAGPRHPDWGDGYEAAIINYRYLAHAVPSTEETVERMLR
ncbi:Isochorismatase family protein [Streptosporangium subroseum]|uniref:Isochorismatase family protein n=1 Tax=Streptosporangium subroseum TaxID=106412 RepID=A0A239F1V7_9ACTN|nr:isochorismatase family protein [Streptosporangium subroseum]SNS50807.1 Isochorismatase family protein [Streptosporangium subroseum]